MDGDRDGRGPDPSNLFKNRHDINVIQHVVGGSNPSEKYLVI